MRKIQKKCHYLYCFQIIFSCVGSFVLICTVSGILILPLSVIIFLLLLMRFVAISSLRSLKRLEATSKISYTYSLCPLTHFVSARSPLVGHINATLEGLTTIRAFRAEELVTREFDKHQDNYTCAIFTSQLILTAFDFFMCMVTSLATVIVIVRFLFFEHG